MHKKQVKVETWFKLKVKEFEYYDLHVLVISDFLFHKHFFNTQWYKVEY